jgi:hypothetical protein
MQMRTVATAVAFMAVLGCGGAQPESQQPLGWEAFRAAAWQEPDTGVFITNGDELAETEADLFQAYLRYASGLQAVGEPTAADVLDPLIVNTINGRDDRWAAATATNLTYCISSSSFGSRYSAVVTAMNTATAAWEGSANVNFVHASAQDGNCTSRNTSVVFDVRQVSTTQYLARAFFPSSSRRNREILVSTSSFGNISPWTLAGVLRHELGHTIGFRHEHTRPESGVCFEDNNWRALTTYDSSSVMHYPQCNGTQTGDLVLTTKDQAGARALYP